ncbi:MAG: MaoC family dehydratase [Alphaproteobacteria bacterium]
MKTVSYDDLESIAGQETGVSDWVEITQDKIDKFADATGDHQWIHVDTERAARELPTGGTIAHGFLTLSLIPMLSSQILKIENISRAINYGCNLVRFTNMVPTGSKVRGRQVVKTVEPKAGGKQLISEFTVEIEGQDKPACIAETVTIFYG